MPRIGKPVSATGQKIQADRTYVAWQGFSTMSLADHPTTFKTGTLVPGDHPVMRANAAQFVEVEVPRAKWPSPFREALAQPVEPAPPEAA
jgi:hypothetical protein